MAVGNGFVVNAVNETIRVTDMAGNNLATMLLTDWFGGIGSGGDPQVVYDDVAHRWYYSGSPTASTPRVRGVEGRQPTRRDGTHHPVHQLRRR